MGKQGKQKTQNQHLKKRAFNNLKKKRIIKNKIPETKNIVLLYLKVINFINEKLGRTILSNTKINIKMIRNCLQNPEFNREIRKMNEKQQLLKFLLQNRAKFCNTAILLKFHNKFLNAIEQPSLMKSGYFTMKYQICKDIIPPLNKILEQNFSDQNRQNLPSQPFASIQMQIEKQVNDKKQEEDNKILLIQLSENSTHKNDYEIQEIFQEEETQSGKLCFKSIQKSTQDQIDQATRKLNIEMNVT